ncbi:putative secreted membrane protein [Corynebacterium glutamicum MB001]|uniref:Hypothetical membrane protein n=1 Tax=Corynebacterium glutamicum (strain ATCC 13032 / DSM 20300 / JCM 1318 / BCRC 11384 / CCUG 27702 / LMG 3730 / NBRC 12168 / NCIMB 10025 / NRRL B-2784 / 534) TaxID=196627 RepID=Q8NLC7_CORGL|nr:hypothetical protein [Corynebacterium glutamicum]AGT06713.1 putative secreted membrane protein [Corynebacterium glutamicum MB001]ARV65812.1 hypothetical protein B7P23_13405 [Corynebacterium glutamicum]ASW15311.1 putative secreted membrane protein [Corynebacterium glutamicum]AUI02377.1 hypothetical protein CYL77_15270 [Corynebacterium glutamicum]AUI03194.1 hypothetical protein C0I99_03270 [Corynebacterium glutamicum]
MRKLRTASVALLTAGALALTATPAMAQSTTGSSASSQVGDALGASDYERDIWGSSKDFDDVTPFGSAWYGYTLAATAVAISGLVYANLPAIEQAAAQAGIKLEIPRY